MCIAIYQPPSLFRILRIIRCIFEIIFDQYVSGRKGLESGEHSSEKSSHLENQVNCFPAHELRGGHPSKLFLVNKPVEVDVKQPSGETSMIYPLGINEYCSAKFQVRSGRT